MPSTIILYRTPEFTVQVPSSQSTSKRVTYLALYYLFLVLLFAVIAVIGRHLRNRRAQRHENRAEADIEYWAALVDEEEEEEEDPPAHEPLGGNVECLLLNEVGEVVGVEYNIGMGREGGEFPPRYEDVVGNSGP